MRGRKIIHDTRRDWEQAQLLVRVARDPVVSATTVRPGGCGSCIGLGEAFLTVPVNADVDAAVNYEMQFFCNGDTYTLEHDSSLLWIRNADPFVLDCADAGAWDLDFSFDVTSTAAGGVKAYAKDGGVTKARWESDTLWQPCIYVVMKLVFVDEDCPCAPWKPETCLVAVPPP